jgi:hypothetical protein
MKSAQSRQVENKYNEIWNTYILSASIRYAIDFLSVH